MASPYPAEFLDPDGGVRLGGFVSFTDPDNRPLGVVATVTFDFDTPDLLTGIPFFTPTAGLVVPYYMGGYKDATTPFDGATPTLHVGYAGDLAALDGQFGFDANLTGGNNPVGAHAEQLLANGSNVLRFTDATPVVVSVDDGSGGDPGATQGKVTLVMYGS